MLFMSQKNRLFNNKIPEIKIMSQKTKNNNISIKNLPIIEVNINDLKPDPTNPNVMTLEQEMGLEKSMINFGRLKHIVVDQDLNVIDGAHRINIEKAIGTSTVQVIQVNVKDEIERKIIRETLNKLHGTYDKQKESNELLTIFENRKLDDLAELLGQPKKDLEDIISKYNDDIKFEREEDETKLPSLYDTETFVNKGEIWKLGNHLLMCGDCTNSEDVSKLMNNKKADMVFTDPPYAIFGSSTGVKSEVSDTAMIKPFFKAVGKLFATNVIPRGHIYVCCDWRTYPTIKTEMESFIQIKNNIVWSKGEAGYSGSFYSNTYENIVFFVNEPQTHSMFNSFNEKNTPDHRQIYQANVWEIKRVPIKIREHFAAKPVELMVRAIKNSTDDTNIVLDPFLGSGSTLIACEQTNRICYGCEISEHYCSVICERFYNYTGIKAVKLQN